MLVGDVIKLTNGGRSSGIEYRGSRGHFITFKQDPSQLLTILSSFWLIIFSGVELNINRANQVTVRARILPLAALPAAKDSHIET